MEFDKELDARNLNCPLPILRCKKGLSEIEPAQTLKIMATDPGSVKDFQAFCKQTGHELLATVISVPADAVTHFTRENAS